MDYEYPDRVPCDYMENKQSKVGHGWMEGHFLAVSADGTCSHAHSICGR